MIQNSLNRKFLRKEVSYLNKTFEDFKNNLIEFTKTYFPNTFTDFNESDPGMLFIDIASYVGDVLSYYIDHQFKENLLEYAEERSNVLAIANMLGYKPRVSVPASTTLDVYQLVPAIKVNDKYLPNMDYALVINSGMTVASENNPSIIFRTLDIVNFKIDTEYDPLEITVFQLDSSGNPEFFLLKKRVNASAGTIITKDFAFGAPEKYSKINLEEKNVIEILDVTDSDGNRWYEVPYLAQDLVFETTLNNGEFDEISYADHETVPYLLAYRRTSRRFEKRILADNTTQLIFGAGTSAEPDEIIIPSPYLINNDEAYTTSLFLDIDPGNFLVSKTYGQAPSNTTLTVKYVVGGGMESNVMANELTKIQNISFLVDDEALDPNILNFVKSSVACNNFEPALGGRGPETTEEIRLNALAHFSSQNRAVTSRDYMARCYAMPAKFGSVEKVYVQHEQNIEEIGKNRREKLGIFHNPEKTNPNSISIYVLGIDKNCHLTNLNNTVKRNLAMYLSQYRIMTDKVYIRDAYIINIGVNFTVTKVPNYNNREVILNCIKTLTEFFKIDKMQINQPIIINSIMLELQMTEGVRNVIDIEIINKYEKPLYSGYIYDIKSATKNGVIYPSLDPSIFELKYPNKDIQGKIINI